MNIVFKLLCVLGAVNVAVSLTVLNVSETDGQGTLIVNTTGRENCSLTHVTPRAVWEYFRVNDDNDIVLEKPLDLEVIPYNVEHGIQVTVWCTDEPEIHISINVIPVNEFKPEFIKKPYNAEVPEDAPIGTPVFCLFCSEKLAIDGDHIRYGDVSNFTFIPHEIQGLDGAHKFSIDAKTGNITTKKLFDYESRNRLFYVKVQAQDEGGRTGDASIRINVTDVDDNPPKFTRPGCDDVVCEVTKYSAEIDSFLQGKITNVSPSLIYAKDIDSGMDNTLEFSMVSEDDVDLVSNIQINTSTGGLFVQEPFYNVTNVTDNSPITLTFDIRATEVSQNSYSTNVTLIISIYRSLTTLPPSTTPEAPETTRVQIVPLTEKSDDDLAIMLVEILIPTAIVIGIIIVVIVIVIRRSRKMKERSKYDVKDGDKVNQSVIGDRDLAIQARSSLVINPYELIALYEPSHYAKLDSMKERGELRNEGQGQTKGHGEGQDDAGNSKENGNVVGETADDLDSMYARVEKKRPKSSKSNARDVFGSDNHGNDISNDLNDDEDSAPEGYRDVKNTEY